MFELFLKYQLIYLHYLPALESSKLFNLEILQLLMVTSIKDFFTLASNTGHSDDLKTLHNSR